MCNRIIAIFFLLLLCAGASCAKKIYQVAYPNLYDQKYDSEFPYKSCSKELESVVNVIKKVNCTAFYEAYVFDEASLLTLEDAVDVKKHAVDKIFYNSSVAGTATVIYYQDRYVGLLTCAHIVDFPDTMITYIKKPGLPKETYLQSIAFKKRHSFYVHDLSHQGECKILAMDLDLDVALLGLRMLSAEPHQMPVLEYPMGRAKELEWGSFVYLVGYPLGYQMITKGIVSNPNRDRKGGFLIDSLFNEGFSGGIVLAVRDGVPNFELVGIATAVSADYRPVLSLHPDDHAEKYDPYVPYKGEVYVNVQKEINYGITHVISIEEIVNFIEKNHKKMRNKGYDFSHLFFEK